MLKHRLAIAATAATLIAGGFATGRTTAPSGVPAHLGCFPESSTCIIDAEQPVAKLAAPSPFAQSFPNGNLPTSALRPATGGHPDPSYPGTGELAIPDAAAWNAAAVRIHSATGIWIDSNGPDSMYRPFARQVYWRNYWCSHGACQNAATPGTSTHGVGYAIDAPSVTGSLLDRYGGPFGFRRSCSDAPWESWHWHWCGGWSGADPGPYGQPAGPTFQALHRGSRGKRVHVLTTHLALLRVPHTHRSYLRWHQRSHRYNKHTVRAVRRFQRHHHLTADGIYGLKTHRAEARAWRHHRRHR